MNSAARMISSTFRVGKRFRCTMTADLDAGPRSVKCQWSPDFPNKLKRRDIDEYRRGRDAFLAEFSAATGVRFGVVDLGSSGASFTVPEAVKADGRA